MKTDDACIVKSVLAGNSNDFRVLVDKYKLLAEQWAFHHARNMSDAEEIVQEAFVEAYSRLSTLQKPCRFGSWFRRIVTNIAILWFRQRRSIVSFEEVSNIYHNEEEIRYSYYDTLSPLDHFEAKEQADKLDAAISALPQTYRRVIMMFYFDAQSYKEIAAELGISVAALKSRLYRAKEKLKKEMLKNE